jgi:AcrR family transcriptional regulator
VAERGFEGTRFSDVAAHTGTSISTLQYLFGNRHDLVVAALRQASDDMLRDVTDGLAEHRDPVVRLRWLVEQLVSGDAPDAETARGQARAAWLIWLEYTRAGARDAELRAESIATFGRWRALLRQCLEDCVSAGSIPSIRDVERVVETVALMIDGVGMGVVLEHPTTEQQHARGLVLDALARLVEAPELFAGRRRRSR